MAKVPDDVRVVQPCNPVMKQRRLSSSPDSFERQDEAGLRFCGPARKKKEVAAGARPGEHTGGFGQAEER